MASAQTHFRSISLPTRLPSSSTNSESQLKKIQSLNNITAFDSKSIQSGILGLAELYISVEELVQSPANQKSINLDDQLELIDSCNTIRELFQMIRENIQSLQSALRRKGQDSSFIQNDVISYFCLRKKMNKCIAKSLKTLKNLETINGGQNDLISEATQISIAIFKGILVFLSCPTAKSGGWNLISKVMLNKSEASRRNVDGVMSEVESVDLAVNGLKLRHVIDGDVVQKSLQDLDSCILGFETGLEKLFRQFIRCRVAILNINSY